ncbi:Ankyrin repeat protein 1 [Giardia muris]|uniref:Ankyrin repeat protein 1 n=1 Tax=Giardia muris TaxID=5742 RepID=A0A4Z1T217_GIAMU|nr:Ankyrin repeat protein 1 [Giardia muris]|eukprot:TNJ28003.1 Ankyrin repeat protein 1 [Giardia muris]
MDPWFSAINGRDYEAVVEMAPKHAKAQDRYGETGLMIAAREGDLRLAEALHSIENSMRNNEGETALLVATKLDRPEIVKLLAPSEGRHKLPNGSPAIHVAVDNDATRSLEVLLPYQEGEVDAQGYTPLAYACFLGKPDIVDLILLKGKLKKKDLLDSATSAAETGGHPDIANYLRNYKADRKTAGLCADFVRKTGKGPGTNIADDVKKDDELDRIQVLMAELAEKERKLAAMSRENELLANKLSKAREQPRETHVAVRTRQVEAADPAPLGAGLNYTRMKEDFERDCDGNTPLMLAVEQGDVEAAKPLIQTQAKHKNIYGTTALMLAAAHNHVELVKLLIPMEAGMRANSGTTALMKAAHNGHLEVCKLLLEKEAGLTRRDGWTALMSAAANNRCDVIQLLLSTEQRMATHDGTTALHKAVVHGFPDAVRLLAPAEHECRLRNGSTAFYMVNREKNREIYDILSEYNK